MNRADYSKRFNEICQGMMDLTQKKGSDYAGADNVFRNFEFVEKLTEGRVSAIDGLLVRMSDKFMRASNLLTRSAQVADEKVTDTLLDLACYSIILKIMLENREIARCEAEIERCNREGSALGAADWAAEKRLITRNW
jgi:hypothetical protein